MDSSDSFSTYSHRPGSGHPQLVINTQLLQMVAHMQHIDELFLWLTHTIGQRLNIPIVQLWANQAYATGLQSPKLWATVSQNLTLPLRVVNNAQVAEIVKSLLSVQHGVRSGPVGNIFTSPEVDLLTRYNLHYWECIFLSSSALLPPMNNDTTSGTIPTPLAMIVSLFTYQPTGGSILATINSIFEFSLSIAKKRGLLLEAPDSSSLTSFSLPPRSIRRRIQLQPPLTLNDLVPHHVQNVEAMQATNPLSSVVVTSNKWTQRLYSLIDGKRNVADILYMTQMDQQEFTSALRWLLKQKLIKLYEPRGKPVDSAKFLSL